MSIANATEAGRLSAQDRLRSILKLVEHVANTGSKYVWVGFVGDRHVLEELKARGFEVSGSADSEDVCVSWR